MGGKFYGCKRYHGNNYRGPSCEANHGPSPKVVWLKSTTNRSVICSVCVHQMLRKGKSPTSVGLRTHLTLLLQYVNSLLTLSKGTLQALSSKEPCSQ